MACDVGIDASAVTVRMDLSDVEEAPVTGRRATRRRERVDLIARVTQLYCVGWRPVGGGVGWASSVKVGRQFGEPFYTLPISEEHGQGNSFVVTMAALLIDLKRFLAVGKWHKRRRSKTMKRA